MRKYGYILTIDTSTFDTLSQLHMVNEETGKFELIMSEVISLNYSIKEQATIRTVNDMLSASNKELLTDEEIKFLLDPTNASGKQQKFDDKVTTPADLQRLAGFTIEKTVIQHDDSPDG